MVLIILIVILSFFLTLSQKQKDEPSSYTPNPGGHWVNKGTEYNEKWEWWEPEHNRILLYVSVLNNDVDEGYIIVVDEQLHQSGIEYVDCEGKREAEIAVSLYNAYYSVLGIVTVTDLVGINHNKDMNGGLK
ncbi:hypothetical protein J42TS3_19660 [Paenibacillus vini]|uniref:DUF4944 domain-containing protein n=2 Tax=Paenibacillus vini TaxID=1476024 RepID=A0ABQ4MAB9_9BACL|nr:hypothetical protein J42TS3_19660 [Paenibacillus vini]